MAGALKDVKRALLDSDVNLVVANAIVNGVKERAVGVEVTKGVTAEQQFIKMMYDELVDVMGGQGSETTTGADGTDSTALAGSDRTAEERPQVILMAGLQGAGKTTSAAKLALAITNPRPAAPLTAKALADGVTPPPPPVERGCILAAADVYRPAAIKQLQTLGQQIGVEVFTLGTDADPVDIATGAVALAADRQKATGKPFTVIVDTAGRQVVDGPLMAELGAVKAAVSPDETLLVVDAMTGQEAATLTDRFNADVGLTGAVLTKLDGDTRGGAAISVRAVSGCPIKFVGVGEKMAPLEPFYPDRLASRILGMGDVVSLVEKAQQQVSEEEALLTMKKMQEASFDFDDFVAQAKMVSNMGGAASMLSMMPGMGGISKDQITAAEQRMAKYESIISSMTKKERADPGLLITDKSSRSRQLRIAKGCGRSVADAAAFLAEFQQMRTMMSRMSKQAPGQDMGSPEAMAMAGGGGPAAGGEGGSRAARRASKKGGKGKGGKGNGKGGFGAAGGGFGKK